MTHQRQLTKGTSLMARRRAVGRALLRMRKHAGFSQSQVAKRAQWTKAFVSRLERAGRAVEDPSVLARYAAACGHAAGLLFGAVEDGRCQITDTVTLTSPVGSRLFDSLKSRAF